MHIKYCRIYTGFVEEPRIYFLIPDVNLVGKQDYKKWSVHKKKDHKPVSYSLWSSFLTNCASYVLSSNKLGQLLKNPYILLYLFSNLLIINSLKVLRSSISLFLINEA